MGEQMKETIVSMHGINKSFPTASDYKIALITMDSIDQHWITLTKGAQKEKLP